MNLLQLFRTPTHIQDNMLDMVATSNSNQLEVIVLDDPFPDQYPINVTILVEKVQSTSKFSTQVFSKSSFDKVSSYDFLAPAHQFLQYPPDMTA